METTEHPKPEEQQPQPQQPPQEESGATAQGKAMPILNKN